MVAYAVVDSGPLVVEGKPWPCQSARSDLVARVGGTDLSILMAVYLGEAAGNLVDPAPAELYRRLLAWTRQA